MFLVKVDSGKFLVERDYRTLTTSEFPSRAEHFAEYGAANSAAQQIRKRGFPNAVVTDEYGQPVSLADLSRNPQIAAEREKRFWGE